MRKGQAAMEFLMTYGWAILVVLVAIGALAYFGVLSPARFLPSSCTLVPGMGCENFKIDDSDLTDYIYMEVRNGMGEQLTGVSFTLTSGDCSGTIAASDPNPSFTWNDGNLTKLNFTCSGGFTGSRAKADIAISYTKGGLSHTASGTITAPVE